MDLIVSVPEFTYLLYMTHVPGIIYKSVCFTHGYISDLS